MIKVLKRIRRALDGTIARLELREIMRKSRKTTRYDATLQIMDRNSAEWEARQREADKKAAKLFNAVFDRG